MTAPGAADRIKACRLAHRCRWSADLGVKSGQPERTPGTEMGSERDAWRTHENPAQVLALLAYRR